MRKVISILLLTALMCSFLSCFSAVSQSTTSTTTEKATEPNIPISEFYELPVIYVDCENNSPVVSKETYVDCKVTLSNCDSDYYFEDVSAGIRTRGNSSSHNGDPVYALYNQVPYRIKFDKKQSMLGLNDGAKCKSWVLLKPSSADAITYTLGQEIFKPDGYYSSDCQYVELYLNNEYKGVYLLAEQSQINENRVDVFETPEGYTSKYTGYFLELNNYPEKEDINFYTNFGDLPLRDLNGGKLSHAFDVVGNNIHMRCYTLKNDNISLEQYLFIQSYLNDVFSLSYNVIMKNIYYEFSDDFDELVRIEKTDPRELIGRYIDLDSLVDMYLIQEISMNTDVGAGSFYLSADFSEGGNQKLTFECPWDFNWSMRGNNRYTGEKYEGLSAATFCPSSMAGDFSNKDRSNPWLILFMNAYWFREMVYERFCELQDVGAFERVFENIDFWLDNYQDPLLRNQEKWGDDIYTEIEKNKKWLENRLDWLEKEFRSLAVGEE